jgi:ribonucleoside-diphosphate reductase alpha chain
MAAAGLEADAISATSDKPLTPQELRDIIAKSKEGEDDDCLMCGS